jgi:hypothetical protein
MDFSGLSGLPVNEKRGAVFLPGTDPSDKFPGRFGVRRFIAAFFPRLKESGDKSPHSKKRFPGRGLAGIVGFGRRTQSLTRNRP